MKTPDENIPLDSLIEILELYVGHIDKNKEQGTDVLCLRNILFSCFSYLTVYKEGLDSLVRVKNSIESLQLSVMDTTKTKQ